MSSDMDAIDIAEIGKQPTSTDSGDVPVDVNLTKEAAPVTEAAVTTAENSTNNEAMDVEIHEPQLEILEGPTAEPLTPNDEKNDMGEQRTEKVPETIEINSSIEESEEKSNIQPEIITESAENCNELDTDAKEKIDTNNILESVIKDDHKAEAKIDLSTEQSTFEEQTNSGDSPKTVDNVIETKHLEICEETDKQEGKESEVHTSNVETILATDHIPDLDVQLEQVQETSSTEIVEKLESATTSEIEVDHSAEANSDIFFDKECINCECPKNHKQFLRATLFALNYFKVSRKRYKNQFICIDCYDHSLDVYEKKATLLTHKQPLLLHEIGNKRYDYVEIDSSDEEDSNKCTEPADSHFSHNDLVLIENELESAFKNVFQNIEIQNQLTWSKTILAERTRMVGNKIESAENELRRVQEIADRMQNTLYNATKIEVKELLPFDINCGPHAEFTQIPPAGEIDRPAIKINGTYYAVKTKAIASWVPCRVIEQVDGQSSNNGAVRNFKIKYLMAQYQMVKTVSSKHLAYYDAPAVRLIIGTRVIAYFDATTLARGKEKVLAQSAFYPGIIAEPLKQANKFRYLIFYDDGYTQYVQHKDVRLVCQAAENVWEDVHPASRDFIQKYVEQYSVNRPMVQTQKGQSMNTESNGTWHYARVIDIDCSLVLMQFEGPRNHTEWIYRGSLRLGPVFKEYQKSLQKNAIMHQSRMPRRTEPFIRYTEEMETSNTQTNNQRTLAKKSVSRQSSLPQPSQTAATSCSPSVRHLNNSTIYVDDESRPKGQVVFYTAKRNLPPREYKPHNCSDLCLYKISANLDAYSPLAKPLLSGWERMIFKQKIKRTIVYRAPCGKSLRNIEEVRRFLRSTNNTLNVDNFDFCPDLNCLAEYVIDSAIVQRRDISNGQEKIAIPLVNYYDQTLPPPCIYAAQRIPTEGVFLNLDEEFLPGCDCEDDCSDKSKCSCWQLTIEGVRYCNPNKPIEEIGYQYKRLLEHVATGIYECNPRCKCKSNCLNRVVQHSLEMKLQVFKTSNRGWGLRCINDIPKGAFICIYAGHLLTETKANEGGIDAGDEYFADLDYIEVAEQLKEGYESDVEHSEPDEEEDSTYRPDLDDDDEFRPNKYYTKRNKTKERLSRSNTSEEDSQERQVISFNPNADMDEKVRENSVRTLFGKDEAPYIMDAKTTGNLGRYFNHSCSPNLFVQNVFVDTHDLRFPWVAFFAANHIRSGAELTWNYNYEVGVVPGKVLYCQCGSQNCRVRLL